MKFKNALICLLFIVPFHSCRWFAECYAEFTGKVVSNSTKAPVEGAIVELLNGKVSVKTDKNGFFKISATAGCFDANFRISKGHYKPLELTVSSSIDSKSYKVKSESKFINYDKPFYVNPADKNSSVITGTWIKQNSESFSVSSSELIYYLDTLKNISEEINDIQKETRMRNNVKK